MKYSFHIHKVVLSRIRLIFYINARITFLIVRNFTEIFIYHQFLTIP